MSLSSLQHSLVISVEVIVTNYMYQLANQVSDITVLVTESFVFGIFCQTVLIFTARCTLVQSAVLRSHVVYVSVRPSVRLSVCPSVTLVNCDHIGWNSSEIISPSISWDVRSLQPQHDGSAPRGTPLNLGQKSPTPC